MTSTSVIIPIFNGIRYLPAFLDSLAAALPQDSEVIFIDDCSTEPVLEIVKSSFQAKSPVFLRNDVNLGYSATVNRAFRQATGDIIIQLNTDLILHKKCIAALIELIEETSNIGIVGSKLVFPTTGLVQHIGMGFGQARHRHIYFEMTADSPLCLRTRPMQIATGATVAMSRNVLDAIGPLDEEYYNCHEDIDHCLVAHKKGYTNYTCAESIAYHWVSQSGPARFSRIREADFRLMAKWGKEYEVDMPRFYDEAFEYQIGKAPELCEYPFKPIILCRSIDDRLILEAMEKHWPRIGSHSIYAKQDNNPSSKLWLPMLLSHRMMSSPDPYIYIVDKYRELIENKLWFDTRRMFVENELIIDLSGAIMTTSHLLRLTQGGIE